jgi:cystathionine beta-lyase/cystathionine gamma-synthase
MSDFSALLNAVENAIAKKARGVVAGPEGGDGKVVVWMESISNPVCKVADVARISAMVDTLCAKHGVAREEGTTFITPL